MSTATTEVGTMQPAEQYDDTAQQHAAAQLGMWVFLATEILFFGVLFVGYMVVRIRFPEACALGSQKTDVVLGAIEAVILLLSSAIVTWALALLELGSRRLVAGLLVITALLGVSFLVLHGAEYVKEYHEHLMPGIDWAQSGPHAPAMEQFFFLYYAMTLYHSLHVLIGIGAIGTMAMMVWRRRLHRGYTTPLVVTCLYWHLVDIVWIFLFPLIYLIAR